MTKEFFLIFLLFFSVIFLLFPLIGNAVDIDLSQLSDYLALEKRDNQYLISSLLDQLTLKWTHLISSGYSTSEEQAVIAVIRHAVRTKVIQTAFVEVPGEIGFKMVKAMYKIAVLALTKEEKFALEFIKELEKLTAKQATEYAVKWFLQKEIKVGTGNLEANYTSHKGNKIKAIFPYIIVYQPSDLEHGKIGISIHSSKKIEPPLPEGNPWSPVFNNFWFGDVGETLSPFIVHIKGEVEKTDFGTFRWVQGPEIKIEFTNDVPEFDFKEPSLIDKIKDAIKEKLEPLLKIFDWFKGLRQGLFEAGVGPEVGITPDVSLDAFGINSSTSGVNEGDEVFPPDSSTSGVKKEGGRGLPSTSDNAGSGTANKEIQNQINDISGQISAIQQRINELNETTDKVQPTVEVEPQKEEESEIEEELLEQKDEILPKILISEVCVGLDKAANEFVELYNPNDFAVQLNNDNFQLKLVNSSDKATKKKIDWTNSQIPAKSYFLFVGGELIINGQKMEPDANFSSQLTSSSGVIIMDSQDNVIDKVGWGKIDKPAPKSSVEQDAVFVEKGLATGQSINRKGSSQGLADTDNNFQDFIINDRVSPTNSQGQKLVYKKPSAYSVGSLGAGPTDSVSQGPPPEVLITEIQIDGSQDFVEIYNPGENEANLSGCRLRKRTQTGTEYSLRQIPDGTIIPAKNYLLWASSKSDYHLEIGAEIYSSSYLSKNNSVALLDKNDNLIDAVAWGEDHINPFQEGLVFSQNPESGQTIGRKWDLSVQNYQDTDNNQNDFELQFSTPGVQNQTFQEPEPELEPEQEQDPEPEPEIEEQEEQEEPANGEETGNGFNETAASAAGLQVEPLNLDFTAIEFGENPESQNLTIENTGFGELNWQISEPENDWLYLEQSAGISPANVLILADISGLQIGLYEQEIEVTADSQAIIVLINLTVEPDIFPPAMPTITSHFQGQIINYSQIVLAGTAEPNCLVFIDSQQVRADESGQWQIELVLQQGENTLVIKAQDEAGNQSPALNFQLTVEIPRPILEVFPSLISFEAERGGENPGPEILTIENLGSADMNWEISQGGIWVLTEPESGVLGPGKLIELDISADISGLDLAGYGLNLYVAAEGAENSPWQVSVSLMISEPKPEPGPEPEEPEEPEYCSQENLGEPIYQPIIINEIAWMGTNESHNDEWIELKNISFQTVSLENWQLLDQNLDIKIIFGIEDLIEPGGFYLLERTDDNSVPSVLADKIYTGALNNENESLRLFDNECHLIDAVEANPDWPAGDNTEKRTMERRDNLNWYTYAEEGAGNILGTPKAENSVPEELESEPEPEPVLTESFFWNQVQKDSQRSGRVSVSVPASTDKNQIIFNQGFVRDIIIGNQGTIYFVGPNGVYSMDKNFQEKWVFEQEWIMSLAGASDGKIIAVGRKIIGLDQAGTKLWEYDLSEVYEELRPAIFGNKIYVLNQCIGFTGFGLFVFDLDGNLEWVFDTENSQTYYNPEFNCGTIGYSSGAYISSPAVSSDGTIYFGDRRNLYAVSSEGALKWKREFDINRISAPSIGPDGTVYVISDRLLALDSDNGNTLWEFTTVAEKGDFGPAFGSDGALYVSGWRNIGRFYALNSGFVEPENRVLWKIDPDYLDGPASLSSILILNNAILFTSNDVPHARVRALNFVQEFDDYFTDKQIWSFYAANGSTIRHLAIGPDGTIFISGQKLIIIRP